MRAHRQLLFALSEVHIANSFQIISNTYMKQTAVQMTHPKRRSSTNVDFTGLTDDLTTDIARDLNLDKYTSKSGAFDGRSIDEMTAQEKRDVLAHFVQHHPDAERQVARLVLQYLGINKSVFIASHGSSITSDSGIESMSVDLNQTIPLKHSDDDIMPNLSPVSWLSQRSWSSMPYSDKLGFMKHLTNGRFRR